MKTAPHPCGARLWDVERATDTPELLDGPLEQGLLAGNLRDLRRVNRWLGGIGLTRRAVELLVERLAPRGTDGRFRPGMPPVHLLDVGTGAGDIPAALLAWADGEGLRLEVEAIDERPEIVTAARAALPSRDDLRVAVAEGHSLPYPDDAFDIVHASLVLHHLEPSAAVDLLREMARTAALGVVVNDLDRQRLAWIGAWALTRVATGNRYTRHDAPLSVRRAYRPAEVTAMAAHAGLVEVGRFHDLLRHRYALVFVRDRRRAHGRTTAGGA
jgi:ubiquinone/menaquinone biosynthesis C-methylase UbiE